MFRNIKKEQTSLEKFSGNCTRWVGSSASLIGHTIIFIIFFVLGLMGYSWSSLLLILTTIVSLEAIYLAILIQISVNMNTRSLEGVEENLGEIQEDIDEIQEEVEEISGEEETPENELIQTEVMLRNMESTLNKLLEDFNALRNNSQNNNHQK
jgi:low affinity Fe/Cu permease